MSTTSNVGRPRKPAKSRRGKLILAALDAQGLTLYAAAARAGVGFEALRRVIHEDPDWLQVRTVVAVCSRPRLPLELVAPSMAKLTKPGLSDSSDSSEALAV